MVIWLFIVFESIVASESITYINVIRIVSPFTVVVTVLFIYFFTNYKQYATVFKQI